ncbi:hypothetical protein SAMN05192555_102168 [Franzmannia pantelleriensis]|uniref:Uncharacterized protein n=1 Tax=Franzmannia pantelleriensis TaxID=48727 RepID=A0A1G9GJL7_9GAMM|nr:hypothetical protein [Halomonas pantelleriensis]SDL00857.1 hypothetical protein SAMN05192555_102168 [Halomonas pantelleriensis]
MRRDHLTNTLSDEQDIFDAVNDDSYLPEQEPRTRSSSRADTLRARRQVESLLEERRLKRAIEDDWLLDDEEE